MKSTYSNIFNSIVLFFISWAVTNNIAISILISLIHWSSLCDNKERSDEIADLKNEVASLKNKIEDLQLHQMFLGDVLKNK